VLVELKESRARISFFGSLSYHKRGSIIVSGSGSSDRSQIFGPVVWLPLQFVGQSTP
jgi:hypothetical protein